MSYVPEVEDLRKEIIALRRAVDAVQGLIESSLGVAGLHLNGDLASWESLLGGGRFEEWLSPLSEVISPEDQGWVDL